jgi:hypothetical protein
MTIEVCVNVEFIRDHVIESCRLDAEAFNVDAATRWVDLFTDSLGDACINWKQAEGLRRQYHGWNGARFKTRGIGWGSFDDVPAERRIAIDKLAMRAAERCR